MDESIKKDPIYEKIMATRHDYMDNDVIDPDDAIAAALDKRELILKRHL